MTYGNQSYRQDGARRPFAGLTLAALAVALALVGCAPAATSGGKSAATPAPTATSAPKILYQADFTNRASEWKLPPHWSIVNGALQNDGRSSAVIELPIPYQVTTPNYTLSMQILTLAANGPGVNDEYGFLGKSLSGKLLYTAALTEVEHTLHSYALVYPANPDTSNNNNFGTYDFTPGRQTRPYQVQVEGPFISFLAGGSLIGTPVKSADQLAPVQLVFVDQSMQLVIQSVMITTP
ncbi:MAG TPA: hypothetical protein VFN78_10745 [Ktedonobacterales bacterium]|nr:hypothetical protein [Ktedonobacterales bacterium]